MKERPIIFSGPMVRAILEGRKTQMRRVVKPQPRTRADIGHFGAGMPFIRTASKPVRCPYGQAGEKLWVRQTFALQTCVEGEYPPFDDGRPVLRRPEEDIEGWQPLWAQAHYRATDPAPDLCCDRDGCSQCRDYDMGPHWRPSIHMPRWASRITLEVTGVRVERLQDISYKDAIAEGVADMAVLCDEMDPGWHNSVGETTEDVARRLRWPQRAYRNLWESINGAGSWDVNPWVWVIKFKRVEPA